MVSRTGTISDRGKVRRVVVVGGGAAGLMTTLRLCEQRVPVLLMSLLPARRAPTSSAQGGINAALDQGRGDSPAAHFEDTIRAGDFLANQPPVRAMTASAPSLVHLLDRMGVPFNRTPEGNLDVRRLGGALHARTVFAGATTGQQILYALDDQVRRWQTSAVVDERGAELPGEKMVERVEGWDFLSLVLDDNGVAVGVVAQELATGKVRAFVADAVCLATGGCSALFARATGGLWCTGTAAAAVYAQGAVYANPEFVQLHPTALLGAGKMRLISEGVRGEGGRLWVPRDTKDAREPRDIPERERDYFLERLYPGYGNLVPADIAARAVVRVCVHERRGVFDPAAEQNTLAVYLDSTHLDRKTFTERLAGVLELCRTFSGEDPLSRPLRVYPAVHATMGGLWVDYEARSDRMLVEDSPRNHATSIAGLYACGEVDYQYHGANRLAGNGLVSCLFAARACASAVASYRLAVTRSAFDLPGSVFELAESAEREKLEHTLSRGFEGTENPFVLQAELGEAMLRDCGPERDDARLDSLLAELDEIDERLDRARIVDRNVHLNQTAQLVRHLRHMVTLSRLVATGARRRGECRGTHYKPAVDPELSGRGAARDDARWLRTTLAVHKGPRSVGFVDGFSYDSAGRSVDVTDRVDTALLPPGKRNYALGGRDG